MISTLLYRSHESILLVSTSYILNATLSPIFILLVTIYHWDK